MDRLKIDLFLKENKEMFPESKLSEITRCLESLDDTKYMVISAQDYKSTKKVLIFSIFLGWLGVDRFMIGDKGFGVLKLLTLGVFGILTVADWFTLKYKIHYKNLQKFMHIYQLNTK